MTESIWRRECPGGRRGREPVEPQEVADESLVTASLGHPVPGGVEATHLNDGMRGPAGVVRVVAVGGVGVGVGVGVGALPALDPHVVHYDDEDHDHGTGTEENPVEDFHVHSPDLGSGAITAIHGWRGGK